MSNISKAIAAFLTSLATLLVTLNVIPETASIDIIIQGIAALVGSLLVATGVYASPPNTPKE